MKVECNVDFIEHTAELKAGDRLGSRLLDEIEAVASASFPLSLWTHTQ